jgi:hypothetical protein
MEVERYQRKEDLRWVYRIDGKDSEKTYPTAGEAERGAMAAMHAARPRNDSWKWWLVAAAAVVPVIWFLIHLVRMLIQ